MKKIGVIVLGGHVQALGILRAFGRRDVPAIIIDNTNINIARHSKYCVRSYVVDNHEIIDFLLKKSTIDNYIGWIVFPTNDYHVKILSQNKPKLSEYFKITTDNWGVIKTFYNKIETYKLAIKLGIPIAETFFPSNEAQLREIKPTYPCIIKPAVMYDFYKQVKKKVFVCNNIDELVLNYRIACKFIPPEEVIVQNIIQGSSKNQFSACFLYLNKTPYVSLVACRMRQHPIDFGNATTYAETVDVPILKEYAEKILNHTNYNGICEVEFKKDSLDGSYKFLEVNTRTWKWHAIAEKAETPFLINYYKFLNGDSISIITNNKFSSFRHALTDIPIQIKLLLSGNKYAFRKRTPLVKAVWAKDDILPWFYEKIYLIYLIKNR